MSEHPVFPIAQELVAILDSERIPYMLMGGLSVRFWALPRPTYDVDVAIDADEAVAKRLQDRLEREGFRLPEEFRKGWKDVLAGMRKFHVRRFAGRDAWRVDIFLVTSEYQRAAFARRRPAKLLGRDVWTIAAEDLILHKLVAGRERDLVDVTEILQLTSDVDVDYMRRWADTLKVREPLEERLARRST